MKKQYDLQERLLDFASVIIDVFESLPKSLSGMHIGQHLLRSGTSPALHYGEAQAAESKADFIHKMKVCLKELRESYNCLLLISRKNWLQNDDHLRVTIENNELISIFVKSIQTANAHQTK